MLLSGGKWTWVAAAGVVLLLLSGCVSHDQVHLMNPSPCRVRCHADYIAPLDPECHGYHPTCWFPWSCNCPPCPPPTVGVGPFDPAHFQILPEEVLIPDDEPAGAPEDVPPGIPLELRVLPEGQPQSDEPEPEEQGVSPSSAIHVIDGGNDPPALPDYFQ